jgi:histidine triad (HIT) family protein
VHVHLIPLNEMDEMRFTTSVARQKEEFETLAEVLKTNL